VVPLPTDAHIGSVTLTVNRLDRSLAFYLSVLGFILQDRDGARAELTADGGQTLVELVERRDAVPRPRRAAGLYHFAILVPSRAALGRSLRRLLQQGWSLTGAADHLVSEALYLDDPDGLGIEIYRDRPRAQWRVSDGELAMSTDPLDLESVAEEPGAEEIWSGLDFGTVIGHVHLHVAQLQEAETLYCDRVGFTPVVRRFPGALFVAAGGYHHHVGLNTWAGVGAPPPPPNAVGLDRFTIVGSGLQPRNFVDEATRVKVSLLPLSAPSE
jgi:catechol 2,3-dioxygenase